MACTATAARTRVLARRKLAVFACGGVALAATLTATSVLAPGRDGHRAAIYRPSDPARVLATVPERDPQELADRRALAADPTRVDAAVAIAREDISRARSLADPRYLGRAQAALAPWWDVAEPPAEVLLLRATIEQSLHDFRAARADLDQLVRRRPSDAQAHLTRAVVAVVTADYAAARASCEVISPQVSSLVAATCRAPLDALAGGPRAAYQQLAAAVAASRDRDEGARVWALTTLAELAVEAGQLASADDHLRAALAVNGDDIYALGLLADVLLAENRPRDASALLTGREPIDGLLLRRAIAEHRMHGPEAQALTTEMRARIAAATLRCDRVHLREQALFALEVDGDAARALALAKDDWNIQRELADARILTASAIAAHDPHAAAPVIAWARANHVRDAELDRLLHELVLP